jgi:hypothetical protein
MPVGWLRLVVPEVPRCGRPELLWAPGLLPLRPPWDWPDRPD